MDYIFQNLNNLIQAFGTPTVVIVMFGYLFYKTKQDNIEHTAILKRLQDGDAKFNSIEKNLRKITLITMKQEIMNDNFPLNDRERAYRQYKELGGNGYMDTYYNKVLKPLIAEEILEEDE